MRYLLIVPRAAAFSDLQRQLLDRRLEAGGWTVAHRSPATCLAVRPRPGSATVVERTTEALSIGFRSGFEPDRWLGSVSIRESGGHTALQRDPSGTVPAYRARSSEFHLITSHIDELVGWDCEDLAIDWGYLTSIAQGNYMPTEHTGFVGIKEVLPGEEISISGRDLQRRMYWSPAAAYKRPFRDAKDAERHFRSSTATAVDDWCSQHESVAIDLSGGLDSSIIAGLVAQSRFKPHVLCVNATVGHAESDERVFARAVAALHGLELVEFDISTELPDLRRASSPIQPRPTRQLMELGLGRPAAEAARGVKATAYFTGRGGDHVFFHNSSSLFATDYLRSTWNLLGWPGVAYEAARVNGKPLKAVLLEAFKTPSSATRVRQALTRDNPAVTAEARASANPLQYAHPWVLEAADEALPAKFLQVCNYVELQRHFDRIERALELDEAHPFMAPCVLEAGLRTPSYMFASQGVRRQLQRTAFKDLLPDIVFSRRTKGATTSRTVKIIGKNLEFARDLLIDGPLVQNHVLDRDFLCRELTVPALSKGRQVKPLLLGLITGMWVEQARDLIASDLQSKTRSPKGAQTARATRPIQDLEAGISR